MRALLLICLCLSGLAEPAAERELTVLFSANMRGVSGLMPGETGGWVRLGGAIAHTRATLGADRCLWLDGGNTMAGSFVESRQRGALAGLALKHLACDAWVPGPDDLAFGVLTFVQRAVDAGVPVFNANLAYRDEQVLVPWGIVDRGGCRVGVIGFNAADLQWHYRGTPWDGLATADLRDTLEKHIATLTRRQPDALIAVVHPSVLPGGQAAVADLARLFAQFDILLGGAGTTPEPGRRLGRVWYVNPGTDGRYLARLDLRIDPRARRVAAIESQLLPLADEPPDPVLAGEFEPLVAAARRAADEVVANYGVRAPPGTTAIANYGAAVLGRAMARAGEVDCALAPAVKITWSANRPITAADLHALLPGEDRVLIARLGVPAVRAIAEEQLRYLDEALGRCPWGLFMEVGADRHRVLDIRWADGTPIAPDAVIELAVDSGAAAGADGAFPELRRHLMAPEVAVRDTGKSVREALREYVQADPAWAAPPARWWLFRR